MCKFLQAIISFSLVTCMILRARQKLFMGDKLENNL